MPSPLNYQKVTTIAVTLLTAQRDSHELRSKSVSRQMQKKLAGVTDLQAVWTKEKAEF